MTRPTTPHTPTKERSKEDGKIFLTVLLALAFEMVIIIAFLFNHC